MGSESCLQHKISTQPTCAESRKTKKKMETILNKTVRPNSHEFGKAGNRFKLYFEDANDLKEQKEDLIQKGLLVEEDEKK